MTSTRSTKRHKKASKDRVSVKLMKSSKRKKKGSRDRGSAVSTKSHKSSKRGRKASKDLDEFAMKSKEPSKRDKKASRDMNSQEDIRSIELPSKRTRMAMVRKSAAASNRSKKRKDEKSMKGTTSKRMRMRRKKSSGSSHSPNILVRSEESVRRLYGIRARSKDSLKRGSAEAQNGEESTKKTSTEKQTSTFSTEMGTSQLTSMQLKLLQRKKMLQSPTIHDTTLTRTRPDLDRPFFLYVYLLEVINFFLVLYFGSIVLQLLVHPWIQRTLVKDDWHNIRPYQLATGAAVISSESEFCNLATREFIGQYRDDPSVQMAHYGLFMMLCLYGAEPHIASPFGNTMFTVTESNGNSSLYVMKAVYPDKNDKHFEAFARMYHRDQLRAETGMNSIALPDVAKCFMLMKHAGAKLKLVLTDLQRISYNFTFPISEQLRNAIHKNRHRFLTKETVHYRMDVVDGVMNQSGIFSFLERIVDYTAKSTDPEDHISLRKEIEKILINKTSKFDLPPTSLEFLGVKDDLMFFNRSLARTKGMAYLTADVLEAADVLINKTLAGPRVKMPITFDKIFKEYNDASWLLDYEPNRERSSLSFMIISVNGANTVGSVSMQQPFGSFVTLGHSFVDNAKKVFEPTRVKVGGKVYRRALQGKFVEKQRTIPFFTYENEKLKTVTVINGGSKFYTSQRFLQLLFNHMTSNPFLSILRQSAFIRLRKEHEKDGNDMFLTTEGVPANVVMNLNQSLDIQGVPWQSLNLDIVGAEIREEKGGPVVSVYHVSQNGFGRTVNAV